MSAFYLMHDGKVIGELDPQRITIRSQDGEAAYILEPPCCEHELDELAPHCWACDPATPPSKKVGPR